LKNTLRFALVFVVVCALSSCARTGKPAGPRQSITLDLAKAVELKSVTAKFWAVRLGSGDVIEARFTTETPEVKFQIQGGEVLARDGKDCYVLARKERADNTPDPIALIKHKSRTLVLRAYRLAGAKSIKPNDQPLTLVGKPGKGLSEDEKKAIGDCIYNTGSLTNPDEIRDRQRKIDEALAKPAVAQ